PQAKIEVHLADLPAEIKAERRAADFIRVKGLAAAYSEAVREGRDYEAEFSEKGESGVRALIVSAMAQDMAARDQKEQRLRAESKADNILVRVDFDTSKMSAEDIAREAIRASKTLRSSSPALAETSTLEEVRSFILENASFRAIDNTTYKGILEELALKNLLSPVVTKFIAKTSSDEFRSLHQRFGRDTLPDISRPESITLEQAAARRCAEAIIRIAVMPDASLARTAFGPLFKDIIEYLADFLTIESRDVLVRVFYQIAEIIRRLPGLDKFDRALKSFGVNDEKDNFIYHSQVRKNALFTKDRADVKRVVVLPRLTYGAEVAITSVLIKRALELYPQATLYLIIGDKKMRQIFGGNKRIKFRLLKRPRQGGLVENSLSWLNLVKMIKKINPDLIFGPDSRVDSSGFRPLISPERYFYWENTLPRADLGAAKPMAILLNDRLDSMFGKRAEGPAYPTIYLQKKLLRSAQTVKEAFGLGRHYVLAVKYDVGNEYSKSLGQDFQKAHLRALLEEGNVVMLDRGFGEKEEILSQELIDMAEGMGVRVIPITDKAGSGKGYQINELSAQEKIEAGEPALIVFYGSIGGWVSMTTIANEAFSYDSMNQHFSAADKGAQAGIPVVIAFTGYHSEIFPKLWAPTGRNRIVVIPTGIGKCADWQEVLERALQAHREIKAESSPVRENINQMAKEVIQLTAGLKIELPNNLGEVDIYETLREMNAWLVINSDSAFDLFRKQYGVDIKTKSVYISVPERKTIRNISALKLLKIFIYAATELAARQRVAARGGQWEGRFAQETLGSLEKMESWILGQLVAEGKLDLDATLRELCLDAINKGLTVYDPRILKQKEAGRWRLIWNAERNKYEGDTHKNRLIRPVYEPYDPAKLNWNDILGRAPPAKRFLDIVLDGEHIAICLHYQPTSTYHFLLIPIPQDNSPQFLTKEHMLLLAKLRGFSRGKYLKYGFHSWATAASVNHLHLQGWDSENEPWLIETIERKAEFSVGEVRVSTLSNYPARVVVCESEDEARLHLTTHSYIKLLQEENVGHIAILSAGAHYVWPQDYSKLHRFFPIGFGTPQLGGYIHAGTEDIFEKVTEQGIEEGIASANIEEVKFKHLFDNWRTLMQTRGSSPIEEDKINSSKQDLIDGKPGQIIETLPDYRILAGREGKPYFDGGARFIKGAYTPKTWQFTECMLCGQNNYTALYYVRLNRIVKCNYCGMLYTNPHSREEPDDYYTYSRYSALNSLPDKELSGESYRAKQQVDFIVDYFSRSNPEKLNGKFLDLGCAFGFTLYHLKDKYGWPESNLLGVELSPKAAGMGREGLGVDIREGELSSQRFNDSEFDVILLGETIEHISRPAEFMREMRRILKSDGLLVLTDIPNSGGLVAKVAKEKTASFLPLVHYSHFTPETIVKFLNRYGLEAIYSRGSIRLRNQDGSFREDLSAVANDTFGVNTLYSADALRELKEALLPLLRGSGLEFMEGVFDNKDSFERFWNEVVANNFSLASEMTIIAALKDTASSPADKGGKKKLVAVFLTPELAPYFQAGGMSIVMKELPRALPDVIDDEYIIEPWVFTLGYSSLDYSAYNIQDTGKSCFISVDGIEEEAGIAITEQSGVKHIFLRHKHRGLYSAKPYLGQRIPQDYELIKDIDFFRTGRVRPDFEINMFLHELSWNQVQFFNKGALAAMEVLDVVPDVIIANDWFTGMVPVLLKSHINYRDIQRFKNTATAFVIHNLEYQGRFYKLLLPRSGIDWNEFKIDGGLEFYDDINLTKAGIVYSDIAITVSPTYKKEITRPEFGFGLDGVLRIKEAQGRLFGILNGKDPDSANPATHPYVGINFDAANVIEVKPRNKVLLRQSVREAFGVPFDEPDNPDNPIIIFIGRIVLSKGLDIIPRAMRSILDKNPDVQFILTGAGDRGIFGKDIAELDALQRDYPGRAAVLITKNFLISDRGAILGPKIYAGDICIIPSKSAPSELTDLYSYLYGVIPVVHNVGGLADKVQEYDYLTDKGTGFVFDHYFTGAMEKAIQKALDVRKYHREAWNRLIIRNMRLDFSWRKPASEYSAVFKDLIKRKQAQGSSPLNENFNSRKHHVLYIEKIHLLDLSAALQAQGLSRDEPVSPKAVKYLQARAPPGSVYETLVLYLKRKQITFVVDDLGGKCLYPSVVSGRDDIRYFESADVAGKDLPLYRLHVTKDYFNTDLKDNPEKQAQFVLHFFVEKFLPPPYDKPRHELARKKEDALVREGPLSRVSRKRKEGPKLDKRQQSGLDRAVKDKDYRYLLGLIDSYDIRKDPCRIYLQAVYDSLGEVEKKLKHLTIKTGRELLAWHRYMLESSVRKDKRWTNDKVILKISNLIREGVEGGRIRKSLVYRDDDVDINEKDFTRYNHRFVFPYRHPRYHRGAVVFIPQCPVELGERGYIPLQAVEIANDNLAERLQSDFSGLFGALEANKSRETLKFIEVALERAIKIRNNLRAKGDRRAVVIGIVAPAGSGKTTLAELLTSAAQIMGMKSGYLGADGYLHPGDGFRYDYRKPRAYPPRKYRQSHLWGPGIYNDIEIWRALYHLKEGGALIKMPDTHARKPVGILGPGLDIVVTEGVFLGLDKELSELIDVFISVHIDDEIRFEKKMARDMAKSSTHKGLEIILDFSEKQHHETRDGLRTLMLERADFVWRREEGRVYLRQAASSPVEGIIRVSPLNIRNYAWGRQASDSRILQLLGLSPQDISVSASEPVAEMWLASDDVTYPSQVELASGEILNLRQLLDREGRAILGERHFGKYGPYMAAIMKLIDAGQPLSVQAHPAIGHPSRPAKPEMWMIAGDRARFYLGFNQDVTARMLRQAYNAGTLEGLLQELEEERGGLIVVRGALIHAIRKGSLIWEWSRSPTGEEISKGNLERATVSPWDRTDGKAPRPGKEDIEGTIDVLDDAQNRAGIDAYNRTDLRSARSRRVSIYSDRDNNRIIRLFTTGEVIVDEIVVATNITMNTNGLGYPVFILEGSLQIRAPDAGFVGALNRNDCAIIPASLKNLTLINASSNPSRIFRWQAPAGAASSSIGSQVDVRRSNIDLMRNVLASEPYQGYDIIVISSSTEEEAAYQQGIFEYAFGSKAVILSVVDDTNRGNHIGTLFTWLQAEKMARAKGIDLRKLAMDKKIKTVMLHNGGKGERFSPLAQSLGNSRAAQKLAGTITTSDNRVIDLGLLLAVGLQSSLFARTNDSARMEVVWTNALLFGTEDFRELKRSNALFDQFVVKIDPSRVSIEELHDLGIIRISPEGRLLKFYPAKTFLKKQAGGKALALDNKGRFIKDVEALEALVRSNDRFGFSLGTFSMNYELLFALIDYWKEDLEKLEAGNKEEVVKRDLDPDFIPALVDFIQAGIELPDIHRNIPALGRQTKKGVLSGTISHLEARYPQIKNIRNYHEIIEFVIL
ncbi:methyltransferase domain-containing protein, partial [bacterium]